MLHSPVFKVTPNELVAHKNGRFKEILALTNETVRLIKGQQYLEALVRLDRVESFAFDQPRISVLRGACLERLGFPHLALSAYKKGLEHFPTDPTLRESVLKMAKRYPESAGKLLASPPSLAQGNVHQSDQPVSGDDRCSLNIHPSRSENRSRANTASALVDILIPVYRDYQLTRKCIASVLAATCRVPQEIVVINDASPDIQLSHWLRDLAQKGSITLLENPENLGFIGSVNRGLDLHRDRDVVLLNADTEVTGDWLDRLHAAAYREEKIATVTPLSNNAEHFSFPTPFQSTSMPSSQELAQLHATTARVNDAVSIPVPLGIGFCMYLRRACLAEVGYLDATHLVRGYGEEGDYCYRATEMGWQHRCALDVFVAHHGNVSFGQEKVKLVRRNNLYLAVRHPSGVNKYRAFINQDPIKHYRRLIERALLPLGKYARLLVCHGDPDMLRSRQASIDVHDGPRILALSSVNGLGDYQLFDDSRRGPRNLTYRLPNDLAALITDLKQSGVNEIHYSDLGYQVPEVFDLPRLLGLPYEIHAQNKSFHCPRVNALQDGQYCGEPAAIEQCEACVSHYGWLATYKNESVFGYRQFMRRFAEGAINVGYPLQISALHQGQGTPSEDVADTTSTPCSGNNQTNQVIKQRTSFLIGVLGPVTGASGYGRLLKLARHIAGNNLDLQILVLGTTINDASLMATGRVWVTAAANPHHSLEKSLAVYAFDAFLCLNESSFLPPDSLIHRLVRFQPVFLWGNGNIEHPNLTVLPGTLKEEDVVSLIQKKAWKVAA